MKKELKMPASKTLHKVRKQKDVEMKITFTEDQKEFLKNEKEKDFQLARKMYKTIFHNSILTRQSGMYPRFMKLAHDVRMGNLK